MIEIKIESGIPAPTGGRFKYPWAEMNVGDSFFVPGKNIGNIPITHATLKTGFKFVRSTVDGGVRVWRIA